jgi:predicted nucleotidyltransferase
MPTTDFNPTIYPDVNAILQRLLAETQSVLDSYFVGLYLQGSLALGDFNPATSDIDFAVVTTRDLPLKLIAALEAAHGRINEDNSDWVTKLEGSFLPRRTLRRYIPEETPHPHFFNRKFMVISNGPTGVINRHILREQGLIIAGPPIKPLIDPVTPDELREAVITSLKQNWTDKMADGAWLEPPGYQPYIALTCCRALYTCRFGRIASKPVSARWALGILDKEWTDLITEAMEWNYSQPHGDIEKTLRLMKYTMEQIGASALP